MPIPSYNSLIPTIHPKKMTHPNPDISIIVAVASNWAIGKDNDLLWHISDDLKRFKGLTSGHPVIMGRRTFDSLPKRPLPNRRNIVLTRDHSYFYDGVEVCHSIEQAIGLVQGGPEVFIIGGAAIYKDFIPYASKIYATHVLKPFVADVFFPPIDASQFEIVHQTDIQHDESSNLDYYYADYKRIIF